MARFGAMRILVTGAGGFAGGHVARRLAEVGHEVLALTRTSPVEPPADGSVLICCSQPRDDLVLDL